MSLDQRAYTCASADCEAVTVVTYMPATRIDPPYSEPTECGGCGGELADEVEMPEPDYEAIAEQRALAREPDGDTW